MARRYGGHKEMNSLASKSQGISVSDDEMDDLRAKGSRCLIGRLGAVKCFNKEAFKTLLLRIWRIEGQVFFKEIQENLWLFEFTKEEDRQRVLASRLWSYDRSLLVLNVFDGKTPPSKMVFMESPFWVQAHDMPLGCMNRKIGQKIRDSLGRVEEVAVADDDVGWGKCLRIRVVIDLLKPLDRGCALVILGKFYWVSLKYE